MVRQQEFDEMTLITEESTINEPINIDKKREKLEELHRQINGSRHPKKQNNSQQSENEFQFYPGKNASNRDGTKEVVGLGHHNHPANGDIGPKQDSLMTDTYQQQTVEQQSMIDVSQSRFGGSIVADESFAAVARTNRKDEMAQSQQHRPAIIDQANSRDDDDFQNNDLPIETEPASPIAGESLGNTAKVINQQRSFMRGDNGATGGGTFKNNNLQIQVPPFDEDDVIEQTFGIGSADDRNNHIFNELPTPKSRMKREIDIEGEGEKEKTTVGSAVGQNRKKIFDEQGSKRQSEHQVIGSDHWAGENNPVIQKTFYASSQKHIDTVKPQPNNIVPMTSSPPSGGDNTEKEIPIDVPNLQSYFDKMQVGKKVNPSVRPSAGSNTLNSSEMGQRQRKPSTTGSKFKQQQQEDPTDFANIAVEQSSDMVVDNDSSPDRPNRVPVQDTKASVMGQIANNISGMKYQMKNEASAKTSQQQSRTGSPQKKSSIVNSKRDEGSLQISNTPPPQKEVKIKGVLGLKNRLSEGIGAPGSAAEAQRFTRPGSTQQHQQQQQVDQVDSATKKMIVGYQQLKSRQQMEFQDNVGIDLETKDLGSAKSGHNNNGGQSPDSKRETREDNPPTQAQFQMKVVGYHQKRQRTDLEQELEASLDEKSHTGKLTNLSEAYYTKPQLNNQIRQKEELELDERDKGINSDFDGNITDFGTGSKKKVRKLYSQQKRGTRKKILASALKKNKEFKEKINTIEHLGAVSRGLDSNFQIEGRRLIDQIEIDNQSGGTQGNLLNNVDDLADGFNGSNFDTQSVQGYSMNQFGAGVRDHKNQGGVDNYGVPDRVLSMNEKRVTQMQQYQMIKGLKGSFLNDGQDHNRPMSHGQQLMFMGDYPLSQEEGENHPRRGQVPFSIENMRDEYLHELPKSINLHSNVPSGRAKPSAIDIKTAEKMQNQPDHHDVSFKAQQRPKPIPFGKPRLESIPANVLVNVCKFLKPAESIRVSLAAKKIYKRVEEPAFDSLWVLISFQTMFSKTGLTGLRNAGQKRIDEALHQMHFQCESIRSDCKEVQVSIFEKWLYFSLIMVFLGLPTLVVAKRDFNKDISHQVIMMPMTVAWGLLILAQIYAWYRVNKYFKRVKTLHLTQYAYKSDANSNKLKPSGNAGRPSPLMPIAPDKSFFQLPVFGRNAKHCSLYTFDSFVNRFAMANMIGLSFVYLGFFIKIYVFDEDQLTYLQIAPVSITPLLLMYAYEMITEVHKDRVNWRHKNKHLNKQIVQHGNLVDLKVHEKVRCKINCGLLPNFLLFAAYHAGFFCLLCLRLDDQITTSYFIILIPLWIFLIYFSIFLVISGLTSTNHRVNKCEKVILSILVPIGVILTIVLGLCLCDGYAEFPTYMTFIPLLASMIFSYLYVRCLVKPSKTDEINKVKPSAQEQQQSPGDQQRYQGNSFQISQQLAKQMQQSFTSGQKQQSVVVPGGTQNLELSKIMSSQQAAHVIGGPHQIGQGSGNNQSIVPPSTIAPGNRSPVFPNKPIQTQTGSINLGASSNQYKPPLPGVRISNSGLPGGPQGGQQQPQIQQKHTQSQQINTTTASQGLQQPFKVKHAFY